MAARLVLTDRATGVAVRTQTNDRGHYAFASVKPGTYDLEVTATGFAANKKHVVVLNVGARAGLDVELSVAAYAEDLTVTGQESILRSTDGSVSTIIDRKFAANLPVNGRTFGTLLALAPGVSPMTVNMDGGQYSVNGQRSASNYLMVDGVSATTGVGRSSSDSTAGQRPASTLTGGFNGLVSMDALQEIRIQTSSFAPEFGRTPGGQVSVVTRSGTNAIHGTGFEQFRDEAMAASNWFQARTGQPKPQLGQHQFGATLGGPLLRSRTFYFGSYEGLRLLQPRILTTGVPSLQARAQPSALQALFQLYPQPTGPNRADGSAEFITNISTRTNADTWGLRVDHTLWTGGQIFARYSHAPSDVRDDRIVYGIEPDSVTKSMTAGMTAVLRPNLLADVRVSYGSDRFRDRWVGPADALHAFFPPGVPTTNLQVQIGNILGLQDGTPATNTNTQWNAVGSLSYLVGTHHFKTGFDYRRVEPTVLGADERISVGIQTVNQALTNVALQVLADRRFPVDGAFENISFYAQDTWKAMSRLSLSYGLRWDINPAPSFADNNGPYPAITGASFSDLKLDTARSRPLWKTRYSDIAPRGGFSYVVDNAARWTVSGGAGLFGDLSGQAAGTAFSPFSLPNGTSVRRTNVPLPLTAAQVQTSATPLVAPPFNQQVGVIDPDLLMPRTTQWNVSVERSMGAHQSVSATYVGARGFRLLQTRGYQPNVNPDFTANVYVTSSTGRSRYNGLQVEYRRRASQGLQVLTSYTLGRATDTGSATFANDPQTELSTSTLDIRHVFNTAASWDLPSVTSGPFSWALRDWGMHVVATARSGAPFTITGTSLFLPGELVFPRASSVPGEPVMIDDPLAPRGEKYNRAAFVAPPVGEHGNTERNQFRGFAAYQIDMGLQRTIGITDRFRVKARVDAFNVFNTPNFGQPISALNNARFGEPTATLNEAGGFDEINSVYRMGGPRVVEFSLRIEF